MRKNLILVLLALVCALCCAFGLVACGFENNESSGNGGNAGGKYTHENGESHYDRDNDGLCDVCGYPMKDEQNNCDHKMEFRDAFPASCVSQGKSSYYFCIICGHSYWDEKGIEEVVSEDELIIPKLSHNTSLVAAKEASCTEEGNIAYYSCNSCKKYFTDQDGKNEITDKTSVTTEKIAHTLTNIPANESTCALKGNIEYYECDVCGKYFSDSEGSTAITDKSSVILDKLTHNYVEGVCADCYGLEPTEGLQYTLQNSDLGKYYSVGIGTATAKNIIIADEYEGYPVKAISLRGFRNSSISSITIPEGVTSIGNSAFEGCSSLSSIIIPNGVTSIGSSAFEDCSSLSSIIIPDGVTSIESYAFEGCSNLNSIKIPDGLTSIGSYAFKSCSSLSSITIPEGVTSIGSSAFEGCSNLSSINIPDKVTSIGNSAFKNCSGITGINIPAKVAALGTLNAPAFEGCDSLASITVDEDNMNYCSQGGILYDKEKTEIIHLPKAIVGKVIIATGVAYIQYQLFSGCVGITEITIPDSVTTIGDYAFNGCSELICIKIGKAVKYLQPNAFDGCQKLESITVDENNEIYSSYDGVLYKTEAETSGDRVSFELLFVPLAIKGDVVIPDGVNLVSGTFYARMGLTGITIPAGVPSISCLDCSNLIRATVKNAIIYTNAFRSCRNLTYLNIQEGVTDIFDSAFRGCTSLTSVTLPESLHTVGGDAFKECSNLSEVITGGSLTGIAESAFAGCPIETATIAGMVASSVVNEQLKTVTICGEQLRWTSFYGCTSLEEVTLLDGVRIIGNDAFSGCTNLKSVIIPESVTEIGTSAFSGCSNLISVTIPDDVTVINNMTFENCVKLASVTIGNGVTDICYSAFAGCESLVNVEIPESVTNIENAAFSGCALITDITVPEGVTVIGAYAFNGCSSLTDLSLPDGLTTIMEYAFYNCCSLEEVVFPESITNIDMYAFQNSGLTSLTLPDGAVNVRSDAFLNCPIENAKIPANISLSNNTYLKNVIITSGTNVDNTCHNCVNLTSVILPDELISIGSTAFSNCSSLVNIVLPESLTEIGSSAFSNCSSLVDINFPVSLKTIGASAFINCGLTSLTIPDGATTAIGDYAFSDCSSLKRVKLPDSLTTISNYAFYRLNIETATIPTIASIAIGGGGLINEALKTVVITSGTEIPFNAFASDKALTSVTLPKSLKIIGDQAFSGCTSLVNVEISEGLTKIGSSAFTGCGFTEITLPNSITEIADDSFNGCPIETATVSATALSGITKSYNVYRTLKTVVITSGTVLENSAFNGCSSLESVTVLNGITTIGGRCFYGCNNLTDIILPGSITKIGSNAFSQLPKLNNIKFNGTKGQWNSIGKEEDWDSNSSNFTITCSDGVITKS